MPVPDHVYGFATRLVRRWYYARRDAYPDWKALIDADPIWPTARAAAQGGPRVLMATGIGSYAHAVSLESASDCVALACSSFSAPKPHSHTIEPPGASVAARAR